MVNIPIDKKRIKLNLFSRNKEKGIFDFMIEKLLATAYPISITKNKVKIYFIIALKLVLTCFRISYFRAKRF
jgi:uncharacterized membrane protein YhfC